MTEDKSTLFDFHAPDRAFPGNTVIPFLAMRLDAKLLRKARPTRTAGVRPTVWCSSLLYYLKSLKGGKVGKKINTRSFEQCRGAKIWAERVRERLRSRGK